MPSVNNAGSGARPPSSSVVNDPSRCIPYDPNLQKRFKLAQLKHQLTETKQQWSNNAGRLRWIGEQYGVNSQEYKAQSKVVDQLYTQMKSLEEQVASLEREISLTSPVRPFPMDSFERQ